MPTTRSAGRRGRLPVKPPGERFAIQYLSSYLSTPLPPPAASLNLAQLKADIDALHGTGG
jgi:hypothetical protein